MFQNCAARIFLRILSCFAVLFCVLYLTGYAVAFFVLPDTSIEVSQGLILCGVYTLILGITGVLLYLWMPTHGALIRTLCFLLGCWFYLMCIVKAACLTTYFKDTSPITAYRFSALRAPSSLYKAASSLQQPPVYSSAARFSSVGQSASL